MARKLGTEILWPRHIDRLDERKIYFKDGGDIKADVVLFSIVRYRIRRTFRSR
jgi:hypothetical protein